MPTPRLLASDLLGPRSAADVRERFLREVLARIPADRVAEAHLFAPIRQGGVESGVAVLAATPEVVATSADPDAPGHPANGPAALAPGDPERHTVYVAHYRLTLKGPERGRWEVTIREEADAPLLAVDAAVRGVGRRANDAGDAERLDAEALRAFVPAGAVS